MNASLPQGKNARKGFARLALGAGLMVLAVACSEEDSVAADFRNNAPQPGEARLVYDVAEISVQEVQSAALQVVITATGHTRTGGWTEAELVLDEDASEPGNPVYRFMAVPPEGMATQAITPIDATAFYFPTVDTVTVVAQTNQMTYEYSGSSYE
jgi:hypothetical protein